MLLFLLLSRFRNLRRNRNRSCFSLQPWLSFPLSEEFSSSRFSFSPLGKSKQLRSTLIFLQFLAKLEKNLGFSQWKFEFLDVGSLSECLSRKPSF